jgi:ferredoxin
VKEITIHILNLGSVPWQGQHSLLEALEDADIEMNYSCRSGACGVCHVRLVSGEVTWIHSPSVSLTKGNILACCTQPNGDISLELT